MAAICSHLAPNGEKSILYQQLEQKYGPAYAHDIWEQARSQQFLNKYGDWIEESRRGNRGPIVSTPEARKLLDMLQKRYAIEGVLMDMGFDGNYGEYHGTIPQVRINLQTALDKQGRSKAGATGNIQRRTIFHEYLHPFVQILEGYRPSLLNKMYKEAIALNEKEPFYNVDSYDISDRKKEIVVRYLDLLSDMDKPPSIFQQFLDWLSELFFGARDKKVYDTQDIRKLSKDTTVEELYDIFKSYGLTMGEDAIAGHEIPKLKRELSYIDRTLKSPYTEEDEKARLTRYRKEIAARLKMMQDGKWMPKDSNGEPQAEWVEKQLNTGDPKPVPGSAAARILAFRTKVTFDEAYDGEIESFLLPLLPPGSMGTDDFKLSEIKEMVRQFLASAGTDDREPVKSGIPLIRQGEIGKTYTIKDGKKTSLATLNELAGVRETGPNGEDLGRTYMATINGEPNFLVSDADIIWEETPEVIPQPGTGEEVAQTEVTPIDLEQNLPRTRLSEEEMLVRIRALYDQAATQPDKIFRLTYEHTSDRARLGKTQYTSRELANLLDALPIPLNMQFTPSMQALIENSTRRIIEQFRSTLPVEFISRDEPRITETARELLIPKVNAEGKPDGFFTPAQQKEIIDSIVSYTERLYRRDPALKANALIKAIGLFKAKEQQLLSRDDKEKAAIFTSIYNHRVVLAEEALRQLQAMGLYTDTGTIYRILGAVEQLRPLTEQEKAELREANPEIDTEQLDVFSGEFLEATGRIARDWSDNTFELDPKDTASARIKLFMGTMYEMDRGVYTVDGTGEDISGQALDDPGALLPAQQVELARQLSRKPFWYKDQAASDKLLAWLRENYPWFVKENFLGVGRTADYDTIFQEVLNMLGDKLQGMTFDQAMVLLSAHHNPTIQQMVQELRKADQSMKNEFMMVMSKQYQPFVMALFNTTRDVNGQEHYVLNPIKSNRYNQRDTLIRYWQEQQKLSEITIVNESGERVLDVKRIRERWLPILAQARAINDWTTPKARAWFVNTMGSILRISGISVTEEMMQDLFENPGKWTNSSSVAGLFAVNQNGMPAGLFSIFIMKSAGEIGTGQDSDDHVKLSQLNNPLYTEKTSMQDLARLVAKYTPVLYSSNHKNSEGKSVYDWGLNTKLSHSFRRMKENFAGFVAEASQVDIARDSWLLSSLGENQGQIAEIELAYFDGLRPTWGKRGTTRQSMSDREQLLTAILLFQNRGYGYNRNGSKVNYMSLTHGDKTMTPVFRNMPRIATGRYQFMPNTLIGRPDSALFKVFKAEYDRITRQAGQTFNNRQYDQGKSLFYFIPDFNYDVMTRMKREGFLTEAEFNQLWPAGQRKLTAIIDVNEMAVINKILTRFVNNLVMNTLNRWREHGLVKDNGNIFDKQYVQKLMLENGIREVVKEGRRIDEAATEFVDSTGQRLTQQEVNMRIAGTAAKDYAVNSFLFNVALSQLFYGDPAESFKKAKGSTDDMDTVQATMVEYTKRLAKDIAPRADLYWPPDKQLYNTLTMADVKTIEVYLANIRALKEAYADSTTDSTDAQELTTVQEKLDVLFASGKISSQHYNEMSDIIRKAGPGGYYEFTRPEHLNIILQPDKPIYAGTRRPDRGARLTDYVKSSSWALYPPFTRGREIDGLRQLMERNQIARANFESAKKLGSPTRSVQVFSPDGKFQQPDDTALQAAIQQLDRNGFGIQQDVPYDEDKEAIKTITQMNEGITEGISKLKDFKLPEIEEPMTGKALKQYKEQIRKEMLQLNMNSFLKTLNVDEQGNIDPEKVMELLAAEARKKGYTLNELQSVLVRGQDGMPVISAMFNTAADRFEGLLMSMINKIAEVKMPGKSYVQASGTGVRLQASEGADLSGIIRVGDWDGGPLKTLRKENGEVRAAQVILPFNFFDNQGNKLKVEDFLIKQDGRKVLDPARIPPELLQLIGGRIPNQGHSSMLPLEIVGFTPTNMGDVVFIPAAVVKQMGADFDVDKLYTYKRPYVYDPETASFLQVPSGTGDGGRTMEQLQKAYFDVHWAVLTHSDMIEKVLKPLDKDDLKNESRLLQPKVSGYYNFYDPMTQLEDFQRGKEGKRLVGSSSWASKFNARIQDKELQYGRLDFVTSEDGTVQAVPVPAFIQVLDEYTSVPRELTMLSGTGVSRYSQKDGDSAGAEERTKYENHTLVQSEALDNTKNRTLDPLNLTPDTYKAVQAFIQLQTSEGWAPSSKYWTRLITQPVLWDYTRLMKQGNDSLSERFDPVLHNSVFNQLTEQYTKGLSDPALADKAVDITFDPQLLLKARDMKGDEFYLHQLAALNLFGQLWSIGDRMFQLEAQFNQDVSGAGPNLFSALNKAEQLEVLDQLPILGSMGLYENNEGKLTEVGATFDMTNGTAIDIVKQVFPYHALKPVLGKLMGFANKSQLSVDQQRDVLRAFRSYTYTTGTWWWKDAQSERVRLLYGPDSLAKRVFQAQLSWGRTNPMIARLRTNIATNTIDPDFIEYLAASQVSTVEKQTITNGWLYMLMSDDPLQRSLGEDLIRYAYLTGGIQDANSFVQFVPVAWLAGTEFSTMLKGMEWTLREEGEFEDDNFLVQYLQHNPSLAVQVGPDQFGQLMPGREYPESFLVPGTDSTDFMKFQHLVGADSNLLPFVSYRSKGDGKWILYMRNQVGETIWYTRVDTLGNQFSDEYNGQASQGQRSIFPANRSLAERIPSLAGDGLASLQNLKNNAYVLKGFNDNVSNFQQIGVQQGGTAEVLDALRAIRDNQRIPEFLRVVADLLETSKDSMAGKEAMKMTGALNKPLLVRWSDDPGTTGIAQFDNTLHLNASNVSTNAEAAEVFLHELMHNRLMWMVMAAGLDNRLEGILQSDAARTAADKFIQKFRKDNPGIVQSLDELDRIRYEAFTKFRSSMAEVDFREIAADVAAGRITSDDHLLYYSLGSLQEFVAHVPTHQHVARWLNLQESSKGRTLLNRVWDLFSQMIEALGKAFDFKKVKDNSLLKEALVHIFRLTSFDTANDIDITRALTTENAVMKSDNEAQARELQSLLEGTYNRDSQLVGDESGWRVLVNAAKRTATVTGQRGRVLTKLYEQADNISDALSRLHDLKDRAGLRTKHREVREAINRIHQESDVKVIAEVGKSQLKWIDGVLRLPNPTTIDVNLALQAASIWESLINILYGNLKQVGEVATEFVELQSEAQKRRIELVNSKAMDVLIEAMKHDIKLTPLDFKDKLTDIDALSANALALVRAKPALVQGTAVLGWREANSRDEAIHRNTQRITALTKKMTAAGLTTDMMLQMNDEGTEWGLVNRLSNEWYQKIKSEDSNLQQSLDAIERSQNLEAKQRVERRYEVWNNHWKARTREAVFADARIFYDVKTGNRRSGTEIDKAFDQLAEQVGSREYAEELVMKGQQKYRDYLSEREAMDEYLDSVLMLSEDQKQGKTLEEQRQELARIKTEEMQHWLVYNSPIDFLNRLESGKDIQYNSEGDSWLEMAPRKEFSQYYDERYKKIDQDARMREAYGEYRNILQEMISYLPVEIQRELADNFFPIVPRDTASWLANTFSKIRNWDAELMNALTATDAESASRMRPDKIPVMYTYPTSLTKDIGNRSTDLGRTLELFSMMALQHKYMGNVLDTINVAESVLKEVNRQRMSGEAEGKPLRHVIDALKYFKDALIFRKPKELQGKVESPIYSLNPARQHKIVQDIRDLSQEKEKLQNQMSEKMVEGDFDHETEEKRVAEIDKQLTDYEILARNIYGSKFADVLISVNQLKALSFNPFSAVSNYTFAEISLSVHGRGRVDFDPRTLREAMGVMGHAVKRYWTFGGSDDPTARKIHSLMARTGIMGDVVDTDYGQGLQKRKTRTGKVLDPFNWQRSGDYFTKGKLLVAMLKFKTIEVTEQATGIKKTIPLWDAFGTDGEWDTEKYGVNPDWDAREGNAAQFYQFRDRMRKVSTIVFGNQDKNAPVMARKNWLWRLAGQFRLSWFPEGLASRFKPAYYDANLGREVKGRWRSYSDVGFLTSGLVSARMLLSALPGVKKDPFDGIRDRKGNLLSESPVDMENMRKNFAGLAWTAMFTAAILLMRGLGSDDEDKQSKSRRQLLINMLIRNQQDLLLYSSPSVFNSISGNFLPASQVIVDYWNAMTGSAHYLFGDTSKDRHAFDSWLKKMTRAGIPHPTTALYNKIETMLNRDLDKIQR